MMKLQNELMKLQADAMDVQHDVADTAEVQQDVADTTEVHPDTVDMEVQMDIMPLGAPLPTDIQLTVEITAANQTVRINKYFANAYSVNR
jgi:hypothetical protein